MTLSFYYAGSNAVILKRAKMRHTYQISWSHLVSCLWSHGTWQLGLSPRPVGHIERRPGHANHWHGVFIFHQSGVMEGDGLRDVQSGQTCQAHMDWERVSPQRLGCLKLADSQWQQNKNLESFFSKVPLKVQNILSFFCPAIRRRAIKTELVYNNDE